MTPLELLAWVLAAAFCLCIGYLGFNIVRLCLWINKQPCGLPQMFRLNADRAIRHYQEWAERNGADVKLERIERYRNSQRVALAGLVFLAGALITAFFTTR